MQVTSVPAGAEVTIAGRPAGKTPVTLTLGAPAALAFHLKGYEDTSVIASPGARSATVTLKPVAPAAPVYLDLMPGNPGK